MRESIGGTIIEVPSVVVKSRGNIGFEYCDEPFTTKSELWSYRSDDPDVDIRFVYYVLSAHRSDFQEMAVTGKLPQISVGVTDGYEIPVPPLEIQHEVVRVLDSFAELEAELEARKAQYAHYRDWLLSRESLEEMAGDAVEVAALGRIASIKTGQKPTQIDAVGVSEYPYVNAGTTLSGSTGSFNTEGDTVTTPSRGQGGIGFVGYQQDRFWCGPLCYRIRSTAENVSNRYLYFVLQSMSNDIVALMNEGGTPAVNAKDLKLLNVPVPPLSVQQRVVDILDRFDALTTSLTDGLPAEIEARRQQYEYYRDRLLAFPRKG